MRNKDILGYLFLILGYCITYLDYKTESLFMYGMALGMFGSSAYDQLKSRSKK